MFRNVSDSHFQRYGAHKEFVKGILLKLFFIFEKVKFKKKPNNRFWEEAVGVQTAF